MGIPLDFDKPLMELRKRLEALDAQLAGGGTEDLEAERRAVAAELSVRAADVYGNLSAWQKVQVARHPQRPQTLDYAKAIFTDFVELHGDRAHADDRALVGGPARFDGRVVMLVGHQRGRDTKERLECNNARPHPEGYRKACRLFRQAEKFGMPLVTLLDTPAASAGLEDEERGQAWALAENIGAMAELRVPIVSAIIGQGGSGGALAVGVADRLLMFEHAIFSVAPPEAAASILWKDVKHAPDAAAALKLTAQDLFGLGLIDRIVPEPPGGAHSDYASAAAALRDALADALDALERLPLERLLAERYEKYRRIGTFREA